MVNLIYIASACLALIAFAYAVHIDLQLDALKKQIENGKV
jgi:hypothetical protein